MYTSERNYPSAKSFIHSCIHSYYIYSIQFKVVSNETDQQESAFVSIRRINRFRSLQRETQNTAWQSSLLVIKYVP